jgi:REP element-mobilizing transposase RayT
MARKLRVQYPGAIYHVMSRGDHLEAIFGDRKDPELFLATMAEACGKTDWQVHAFCLMSNHFHLVLETPRGNLVEGMKWLLGTYTSRFNQMEARRAAEQRANSACLPRGWCRGSEEFRQELLLQMSGATQARFPGPEWKESAQHKAEGILAEELSRRGWDERTLAERRKADPEKLRMARRFRSETTMTWRWIAQHLHMGAPGYVRNSLRAQGRMKYAHVRP